MGKSQRDKGAAAERKVLELLKAAGIDCRRTAASGAQTGYEGDIELLALSVDGRPARIEVKKRANGEGFSVLEKWLEGSDLLVLLRNRRAPMVALEWPLLLSLLQCAAEYQRLILASNPASRLSANESVPDGPHEGGWL